MTPEERAKAEAWLRKHISDDDPGGLLAISPRMLDAMFPHPDVSGMTPEQAAAARADREARIRAFFAAVGGSQPTPRSPGQPAPVPAPPELPVS